MKMMRRKKRKIRMYLYIPFWLLIVGMFTGLMVIQLSRYLDYRVELNRLKDELRQEEQVYVDLHHRRAFYESDSYIERLARDMLGFVRQDEIVFQNIAD